LYFGIQHFSLSGIISIVVVTSLIERFATTIVLFRKLNTSWQDLHLLKNVGKTALISLFVGFVTFFVFQQVQEIMPAATDNLAQAIFFAPKKGIVEFVSGSLTLAVSFAVYAPIYLFLMNRFELIDADEKRFLKNWKEKFLRKLGKREALINH
jgi:hypothetical protein